MNKLFRPKCLRRVLLCLALLFPIVYLCGGLFFALAGSHGENVLATEETSIVDYKTLDFNQRLHGDFANGDETLIYSWGDSISITYNSLGANITMESGTYYNQSFRLNVSLIRDHIYYFKINGSTFPSRIYNGNDLIAESANGLFSRLPSNASILRFGPYSVSQTTTYVINSVELFDFTQMYGYGNEPTLDVFNADFPETYYAYTLSDYVTIPVFGVPSEQNSLFFHVFGQRNFISQLGKDLINGSSIGFNPMNELFRTINTNIMHFEDTDGLAMFGLGYIYYAVNVLIVYEVLVIAMKLLMLPLRAVDLFDKEEKL